MEKNSQSVNMAFNRLAKREDELYHRYSAFCGLSDSSLCVLYTLYEDESRVYTQNELASVWFYPKQTMNYAVNVLVKKGWVRLAQRSGLRNGKSVCLTEEGKRACDKLILPLLEAEERSLRRLGEEKQRLLLHLSELQCDYLEEEIIQITGGKGLKTP